MYYELLNSQYICEWWGKMVDLVRHEDSVGHSGATWRCGAGHGVWQLCWVEVRCDGHGGLGEEYCLEEEEQKEILENVGCIQKKWDALSNCQKVCDYPCPVFIYKDFIICSFFIISMMIWSLWLSPAFVYHESYTFEMSRLAKSIYYLVHHI